MVLQILFRILTIAMDLVPIAVLLSLGTFSIVYWGGNCRRPGRIVLTILFALYLAAVLSMVGFPNILSLQVDLNANWIPFADARTGVGSWLMGFCLNVILTIPLGLLLPLLWEMFAPLWRTVLFGACFSLLVEVAQIFTFRCTDVDDLIANTLGAVVGWLFWSGFFSYHTVGRQPGERQGGGELSLLLALVVAVAFFVQPFLNQLFWSLL